MFSMFTHNLFTDAPVCITPSVTVVGASLEESISVPCRVIADPSDVTFEWTFSSSGERFEVPHGHYTTVQDGNNGDTRSTIIESNETHAESDGMSICNAYSVLYIYRCFVHILPELEKRIVQYK